MSTFFTKLTISIAALASFFGYHQVPLVEQETPQIEQSFGATNVLPINGTTYYLSGSGVTSAATSFTLTSFTIPQNGYKIQDADLSSTFYVTLEPGNRTKQEVASCTAVVQNANNTASFSGCIRGLSPISPYTASSTLQFSHGGGTAVIFGDAAQLFNQYAALTNDETISATWTFASTTPPKYDLNPSAAYWTTAASSTLVSLGQLNDTAVSGAANASETTKGIIELSTPTEASNGTMLGGTGARLGLPGSIATSTCQSAANSVLISSSTTGKLSGTCFDPTYSYAFSGTETFNATTTIAASSTTTAPIILNGKALAFPSLQGAASTTLVNDGTGSLSWRMPEWTVLATTTLTGTAATTTLSFPSRTDLRIVFFSPSVVGTSGFTLYAQLNSDAGANYGYVSTSILGTTPTVVSGSSKKLIVLNSTTANSGSEAQYIFDIVNYLGTQKNIMFSGSLNNSGGSALAPNFVSGSAVWGNTSALVNSISIGAGGVGGAGTLGIGTKITVYGSNN